ncbi:MAG: sigma-70 family RNA polymerase sigma factor [Planctomycetota bacterium]|nr:sigma-70 family RNA polymerase sigma factor [Planctomycetota bacterium]
MAMDPKRITDAGVESSRRLTASNGESESQFILRLFDNYYERVFCFTRRSAPLDVAEDVTQEVFIRLLQHPRLRELSISCSYLIKIAHNLLRRRHTRWVKLQEILDGKRTEEPSRRGRVPDDDRKPSRLDIREAMSTLKPEEQDALDLIICRGMSYDQAANALNTSVTTINNHKYRGLQKLRRWTQERA